MPSANPKQADVLTLANGRWPSVLEQLGVPAEALTGRHAPCPLCEGGKDRFRVIELGHNMRWICNQCGTGDGMDLLTRYRKLEFKAAADMVREVLPGSSYVPPERPKKAAERKRILMDLVRTWKEATDNERLAEYLNSRGIPEWAFEGADLHFGRIPYFIKGEGSAGVFPAMLARIATTDGRLSCLHRTYIEVPNGDHKKKKITNTARDWPGGAIRLFPTRGYKTMLVAEGIETALSARAVAKRRWGKAFPCWALVSAGNMMKWSPPEGVEAVAIFGDNDTSYTGQAAAYELARRLTVTNKLKVSVFLPPEAGTDWNDHIQELQK